MAHYALPRGWSLTGALRRRFTRFSRRHPTVVYTVRRVRAHFPFFLFALLVLSLAGYVVDLMCRVG